MLDPERPIENDKCNTISLVNVQSRISELKDVPCYPPGSIYTTLDGVIAAASLLNDARASRRAQLQREEEAIEEARQALRSAYAAQDKATHAAMCSLAEQHNTFAPVASLPPEVLAEIFTCLSAIDLPSNPLAQNPWSDPHYGWLAVTFVCRHWRQIALQHARLWADIDLSHGCDRVHTFSARAKKAALSITLERPPRTLEPWQITFLAENLCHTRSLRLNIFLQDTSFDVLRTHAPLLHTVELRILHVDSAQENFVEWSAPALRHLSFASDGDIPAPWMSPLFQHLKSLELGDEQRDVTSILNGLSHMHALERLRVKLAFDVDGERRTVSERGKVAPARLAHLELSGSPSDATTFLSHLALPSQAAVRCDLPMQFAEPDHQRFEEDMNALIPVALASVQSHANSASDTRGAITSLNIDARSPRRASIIVLRENNVGQELNLSLHWNSRHLPWILVPTAMKMFSSVHLKELAVAYSNAPMDVKADVPAWVDLMERAPRLKRLTVTDDAAISFCEALQLASASAAAETPSNTLPFPELAVLVFDEVRLVNLRPGGSSVRLEGGELVADVLLLRLAERAAAGCCLEELDVKECDVGGAWVAKVRGMLPGTRVKY